MSHPQRKVSARPNAYPKGEDTYVLEEYWLLLVQVPWHCDGNAHSYTPYKPEQSVEGV